MLFMLLKNSYINRVRIVSTVRVCIGLADGVTIEQSSTFEI